MKRLMIAAVVLAACSSSAPAIAGPKSALDGIQFDGVSTDRELKVEGHTRRQWLEQHPIEAKDYWKAWDCKGKPCDSKWNANIRAGAALIKRTDKDPKLQADASATSH